MKFLMFANALFWRRPASSTVFPGRQGVVIGAKKVNVASMSSAARFA